MSCWSLTVSHMEAGVHVLWAALLLNRGIITSFIATYSGQIWIFFAFGHKLHYFIFSMAVIFFGHLMLTQSVL